MMLFGVSNKVVNGLKRSRFDGEPNVGTVAICTRVVEVGMAAKLREPTEDGEGDGMEGDVEKTLNSVVDLLMCKVGELVELSSVSEEGVTEDVVEREGEASTVGQVFEQGDSCVELCKCVLP